MRVSNKHVEMPDVVLNDIRSGYAINVPVEVQTPPEWWLSNKRLGQRIMTLRKKAGVTLHDALWEHFEGKKPKTTK